MTEEEDLGNRTFDKESFSLSCIDNLFRKVFDRTIDRGDKYLASNVRAKIYRYWDQKRKSGEIIRVEIEFSDKPFSYL